MTDMKDEHNRANTRWVFEPASAKAGLYRQTLNSYNCGDF